MLHVIIVVLVLSSLSFSYCLRWNFVQHSTKIPRTMTINQQPPENLMTVDEIKGELELRSIDYTHCVSKPELVNLLVESRTLGRADPSIVSKMNCLEEHGVGVDIRSIDEQNLIEVVAGDGNLPGGMSNDMLKLLASDEQIMRMLKDPKMQDMLKAVMSSGPEGMKKYLSDPGKFC